MNEKSQYRTRLCRIGEWREQVNPDNSLALSALIQTECTAKESSNFESAEAMV